MDVKIPKDFQKKLNKQIKTSHKQLIETTSTTEDHIEKHLFKRFHRLLKVRRFLTLWVLLVFFILAGLLIQNYVLSNYFQKLMPVPGGVYNEGIVGNFTSANPIFATNDVDTSMSHLIFSSILSYDQDNKLTNQMAQSFTSDSGGRIYTVTLKPNLTWQDGAKLTADDIVFTYKLIQNPDVRSPYQSYFQGVDVSSIAKDKVVFTLPNSLASFPNYLTIGILPYHILKNVPASELRSASFNTTEPIGSGPFSYRSMNVTGNDPSNAETIIQLAPFNNYLGGKPKLNAFIVHAYANQDKLVSAFDDGKLNGIEGLSVPPSSIARKTNTKINSLILTAGSFVFFKNTNPVFSDQKVRSALIQAVDTNKIISNLGYSTYAVTEPLLKNQLGYNPAYSQPTYNPSAAASLLDQAGWKLNNLGVRVKDNSSLTFNLTVPNASEYVSVAKQIKKYWNDLGVEPQIQILEPNDFSSALRYHQYDSVLYGIAVGNDPDVYVYWASAANNVSAGKWTNLSEYKNATVDSSLENGRIRIDPKLRVLKYNSFLQAWSADLPAMGLYQPRDLYITNGPVFGLSKEFINSPADRLDNVANWEIHEAKVTL